MISICYQRYQKYHQCCYQNNATKDVKDYVIDYIKDNILNDIKKHIKDHGKSQRSNYRLYS